MRNTLYNLMIVKPSRRCHKYMSCCGLSSVVLADANVNATHSFVGFLFKLFNAIVIWNTQCIEPLKNHETLSIQ